VLGVSEMREAERPSWKWCMGQLRLHLTSGSISPSFCLSYTIRKCLYKKCS